ncbi:MAG TPA: hypothetical protein VIQ24_07925 [Pyrinomonadaceae bacterium]
MKNSRGFRLQIVGKRIRSGNHPALVGVPATLYLKLRHGAGD